MADNALTKLSLVGQLGVSLGAAAVIAGAFYYFYFSGALDEERQKTEQLETLLPDLLRRFRALEKRVRELEGGQDG